MYTQFSEMDKLVEQVDGVRHLEASRRVTVGGMNASHKFIIDRERQSWTNGLTKTLERLHYEEIETKEYLKRYLEHLRKMKEVKLKIQGFNATKQENEEQNKNFLITLKKRSKEFEVVRFLFGISHLNKALDQKEQIIS